MLVRFPAELERIVNKALTKNCEERYQSAKDLLIDLRNLKRKLEVDAEIDRTVSPELRGPPRDRQGPKTVIEVRQLQPTPMQLPAPNTSSPESSRTNWQLWLLLWYWRSPP